MSRELSQIRANEESKCSKMKISNFQSVVCENCSKLGPVHMIPGQLIAPGQLTDPRVNFASVHGLTPCNCSHEFFVAPGQLREAGYPLYNTG